MTDEIAPAAAKPNTMAFRKSRTGQPRMDKDAARRQGAISALAFTLLGGRDEALSFLNTTCAALEARPIDLAMKNDLGFLRVETMIRKLSGKPA